MNEKLYFAYLFLADRVGKFNQGLGSDGAAYVPMDQNEGEQYGRCCHNCAFYASTGCKGTCTIVKGTIECGGVCRFFVGDDEALLENGLPQEELNYTRYQLDSQFQSRGGLYSSNNASGQHLPQNFSQRRSSQKQSNVIRKDWNTEPIKKVVNWHGFPINISFHRGEHRFKFATPMKCSYGSIRGTYGRGLDAKAVDVYLVSEDPKVFRITQLKPSGEVDEYKYMLGAKNLDHAVEMYLSHVPRYRFGGVVSMSLDTLRNEVL